MNARRFDHYLGFWNGLLGFANARSPESANHKVTQAKSTLRSLARGRRVTRGVRAQTSAAA